MLFCSRTKRLGVFFAAPVLAIVAGCGYSGPSNAVPAAALQGSVHGGHQPVRGSSVQLYAAGTSGNGSSAQALLSQTVQTDDNGNFSIPAAYGCPAPTSQMFVIAHGGNAGAGSGADNSALTLMAALGSCASLSRVGPISINEVTTVGTVWPLAPFMKSATEIGSASGDPGFLAAVSNIPEFINIAAGSSPGTATATSSFTQSSKLNSLADLLASCVDSAGGSPGDGSPCGQFFTIATPAGQSAPTDTTTAAISVAQHPTNNVDAIFNLTAADTVFQPALNSAPTDWSLPLTYPVAVPIISLPTGTYTGEQQVTISDATPNSSIYYTTDGTAPTSASSLYNGPIAISVSTTLSAIAILQDSQSSVVTSTLTIAASLPAQTLVFLQQPTNASTGATITPAVSVEVEDGNGSVLTTATNPVTLALTAGSGLTGTLTTTPRNGIATFSNLSLRNAGNYTLTATSAAFVSATSASFTITTPNTGNPTIAAKLAFQQQPANAAAGATLSPLTVVVEDSSGNTVSGANNPVTLALSSGSGLDGTLTVAAQNGIATFSALNVTTAGTYTLLATSANLASAVSTSFTIVAPATQPSPARLVFLQQPSNAVTGATISPAVTVAVEDSNGNTVTSATTTVTLALASGSGLGGAVSANARNGIATFSNLSVNAAGTDTLSASSPGLTAATSATFTISAPVTQPSPARLVFLQQPSNAVTGATIAPAVTVAVEDSSGNTVTSATNTVTLALASGSGLGGAVSANARNGVATFSNLSVAATGTDTLSASSPGLATAVSASFTISAPVTQPSPAKLVFLQQPSNAVTGATIAPAVTVAVEDSSGNTVTSATDTVTLALASGSGLGGAVTANPQNGIATFASLSVNAAGSYSLSASSPGLTAATSASFTISAPASSGTTYYLSPTGSDANSGLSAASPWLTPNHSLACGDVISAAPGAYASANFNTGKWGSVNCPAGNSVAWLQCATFDTCKIATTTTDGMWVDRSYWGVQGWEISASNSTDGACFHAGPTSSSIHHVIFANNIANGCMGGGFTAYDRSTSASVDYIVYVGNIAYNSAQGTGACFSGFNIYQPIASDNNAGTHMFVAGNFSWGNVDGDPCAGTAPTDGEGINFDTWDFSQGGGPAYAQQGVIENNIEFLNGGDGIEVENNSAGGTNASIYIRNNTQYGDRRDNNQTFCTGNGEIDLFKASNVSATHNLIYTGFATGCQGNAIYAIAVSTSDATNVIDSNFASGVNGNNTFSYSSGSLTLGPGNILGINPSFAQPAAPSAPSCGGSANVTACMSTVIAGFTPTTSTAKAYGYQPPSATNAYDPLFPQWLCHAALPAGLVTLGCQ